MTGQDDRVLKANALEADRDAPSAPLRKKTVLQVALDQLVLLSRADMLQRADLKKAGETFERFLECDRNKDCHNHDADDLERVAHVTKAYRAFDDARRSRGHFESAETSRPNHPLEIIELAGTIKWFDASKGYGFIVPDNGLPDVLLHITCLRASGYQTAYEGARIHCEVLVRPKGPQAFKILSMDENTAIHPSLLPQRTHVVVTPESDWEKAEVKWFNRVRGFGFLTLPNGSLVFFHMETLRRFGFDELRPGQMIEVRWGHGSKGVTAAELRVAQIADIRKN
jgi:cold shock protein